jgi:hypothetical protein
MSEPKRYKVGKIGTTEMIDCVSCEDYASLKAEVERLTKAGDAFISVGVKMREMIGDHHWTLEFDRVRTDWYFAAKEGKQ